MMKRRMKHLCQMLTLLVLFLAAPLQAGSVPAILTLHLNSDGSEYTGGPQFTVGSRPAGDRPTLHIVNENNAAPQKEYTVALVTPEGIVWQVKVPAGVGDLPLGETPAGGVVTTPYQAVAANGTFVIVVNQNNDAPFDEVQDVAAWRVTDGTAVTGLPVTVKIANPNSVPVNGYLVVFAGNASQVFADFIAYDGSTTDFTAQTTIPASITAVNGWFVSAELQNDANGDGNLGGGGDLRTDFETDQAGLAAKSNILDLVFQAFPLSGAIRYEDQAGSLVDAPADTLLHIHAAGDENDDIDVPVLANGSFSATVYAFLEKGQVSPWSSGRYDVHAIINDLDHDTSWDDGDRSYDFQFLQGLSELGTLAAPLVTYVKTPISLTVNGIVAPDHWVSSLTGQVLTAGHNTFSGFAYALKTTPSSMIKDNIFHDRNGNGLFDNNEGYKRTYYSPTGPGSTVTIADDFRWLTMRWEGIDYQWLRHNVVGHDGWYDAHIVAGSGDVSANSLVYTLRNVVSGGNTPVSHLTLVEDKNSNFSLDTGESWLELTPMPPVVDRYYYDYPTVITAEMLSTPSWFNVTAPGVGVDAIAITPDTMGKSRSVALLKDGTVAAWGDNWEGRSAVPAGLTGVKAIATGLNHTVALKNDGTLVAWGSNASLNTGMPAGLTGVAAITAGSTYTIAVKGDGTVVAWDWDDGTPGPVEITVPAGLSDVKAVATGANQTVALKNDGTLVNWRAEFYLPAGLTGVVAIAAGGYTNTAALRNDGTVVAWNIWNTPSQATTVPTGLSGVKAIAVGDNHIVALKNDGAVVAWGDNAKGQTAIPAGLSGVKAIAAAGNRTMALKSDGTIVSWGGDDIVANSIPAEFTLPATTNGTITCANPVAAKANSLCTITPAPGYQLATFAVNGVDRLASVSNNRYTITNVQANQVVTGSFALNGDATPPTASFTKQVAGQGPKVAFNGTASTDPDGSIASYAWEFGDGSSASGATATHYYATLGTFTVTLTVTDNTGQTAFQKKTVTIANRMPLAADLPGQISVAPGTLIDLDLSRYVSDADGDPLTYTISGLAALPGARFDTASGRFTWLPQALGTYNLLVSISDGHGGQSSIAILIVVETLGVDGEEGGIVQPDLPPCQGCYSSSDLLAGWSVDSNNGAITIPAATPPGVYTITILVAGGIPVRVQITVAPPALLKNPANGHAYQLLTTPMTWTAAKTTCERKGGHLATITSQAENDYVQANFNPGKDRNIWLGGSDVAAEGVWQWVTGEAWGYDDFCCGEPNSYRNENYVHIYAGNEPGHWNDVGEGANFMSLCEWDAADVNPEGGLLLFYPFDGGLNDLSGSGANAINYGATLTADRFGNAGSAYRFDGSGAYMEAQAITIGGAYTVSAWVRADGMANWQRLVDFADGQRGLKGIIVGWNEGKVFAEAYDANHQTQKVITTDLFPQGRWVLLTVTNDGAGTGKIYWNGELKGAGPMNPAVSLARGMQYIGRSTFAADPYFNGAIDDLRIYNRAITPLEVLALYSGQEERPTATITAPATDLATTFGEMVQLRGVGGPDELTITGYEWSVAKLEDGVVTGDPLVIATTANSCTNILPIGSYRLFFRAKNADDLWSVPVSRDIRVQDPTVFSDLAVGRDDITFVDKAGQPLLNPQVGDTVTIRVRLHNLSAQNTPGQVTLALYDGGVDSGRRIGTVTVPAIPHQDAVVRTLEWRVGYDGAGSPLADYRDGYKVIAASVDYTANLGLADEAKPQPEVTYANNLATGFLVVGTPAPDPSYTLNVTADWASSPLYAGYPATLWGTTVYNWGSKVPVMGAEVTVQLGKEVYRTRTTSPEGRFAVAIPLPVTVGEYTATVTVFDNNLQGRKVMTFQVVEPPEPAPADLVVSGVGFAGPTVYGSGGGTYAVAGSEVTLGATIKNWGGLPAAAPFRVSFHDGPASEPALCSVEVESDLAARNALQVTCATPWQPTSAGDHTITVQVDADNTVAEGNEFNNQASRSIGIRDLRPDLRPFTSPSVSGISFATAPILGQPVTILADIYNNGPGVLEAGSSFAVDYYDGDPRSGTARKLGRRRLTGPLAPGAKLTASLDWNTAMTNVTAGSHEIFVQVDPATEAGPDGEVTEDFEGNNLSSRSLTIFSPTAEAWLADLTFSNYGPMPGTGVKLFAWAVNLGGTDSPGETVDFFKGDPARGGVPIGTATTAAIGAKGGQAKAEITWTPDTVGTYFLYIRVNGHTLVRPLTVYATPPPDLQVLSPDIQYTPGSPASGDQVTPRATIHNLSPTRAAANFKVSFAVDSPTGFTPLGAPVTVANLAALAQKTVTAPEPFTAIDPYYAVKVTVIPTTAKGDANFADNEATTSIGIDVDCPGPLDLTVPADDPDGEYLVRWHPSATPGVVTYVLEEATTADFTVGKRTVYTGPEVSAAVSGRAIGKTYYYRVLATKSGATPSVWTMAENGCLVGVPCDPPGPLAGPASDADGSYTVRWTASTTLDVTYVLEEATSADFTTDLRPVFKGKALRAAITGRIPGKTYFYRVKAAKPGVNTPSAWVVGSKGCLVGVPCDPPGPLTVPVSDADGRYVVSWLASTTPEVTYVLEEATNIAFTADLRTAFTGTVQRTTIKGRTPGVIYYYRVKATKVGSNAPSLWTVSGKGSLVGVPCEPSGPLTVPASDPDGDYAVSWVAATTPGVTYLLEEATDPAFTAGQTVYTGVEPTASITGRTPGVIYYYRVKATKIGSNAPSPWTTAASGCLVGEPCGLPTGLKVPEADPNGSYTVSWGASTTEGVTYTLEEATNPGFSKGLRTVTPASELSATITGRTFGLTYYYRVRATKPGFNAPSLWQEAVHGCAIFVPRVKNGQVAGGGSHSLGLQQSGRVVAVGNGHYGQTKVATWTTIVQVAAGAYHSLGLRRNGTVVAVGWNSSGQTDTGGWSDIVQVAAGRNHSVGLLADGTVVTAGNNAYHQRDVETWSDIVQVAAGPYTTIGLQADGTVVAVGWGADGQTEVGEWADIVQVAAGRNCTVGLTRDGMVVGAGDDSYGDLTAAAAWTGIVQVVVGEDHIVGLKSDGTVVAVGDPAYGQTDVDAWSGLGIVQLAAGYWHTIGLRADGTVEAVGDPADGQTDVEVWTGITIPAP